MLVFSASHYHRLVFSAALGKTAERMVVGRHRTGWRVVPHCSTNDGQAALQLFSRTETELLQLRAILQLLKGGESKVGAESREEFLGRRRGRQVPTWIEKEPPWWCASLPAAGGAGSTNNYLTISQPGNKQSLASTTTTNNNDNY